MCDSIDYNQTPLSMEFSRQAYWSGLLFPLPGDLPYPGIKPESPALNVGRLFTTEPPGKPPSYLLTDSSFPIKLHLFGVMKINISPRETTF